MVNWVQNIVVGICVACFVSMIITVTAVLIAWGYEIIYDIVRTVRKGL
jgi:hypothetical protein